MHAGETGRPRAADPSPRRRRWRGSLSTRLLLALWGVALIPISGLLYTSERFAQRVLTERSYYSLQTAANNVEVRLDAFFQSNMKAMQAEAALPIWAEYLALPEPARQGTEAEARARGALASLAHRDPLFIRSYALVELGGKTVLDLDERCRGVSRTGDDYFRAALRNGLPYASGVQYAVQDGAPELAFSSPIFDSDGKPVGVLVSFFHAAILQQLLIQEERLAGLGSFPILLDENHLILAYGRQMAIAAGDVLLRPLSPIPPDRAEALRRARRLPPAPAEVTPVSFDGLEEGLELVDRTEPYFSFRVDAADSHVLAGAVKRLETQPWFVVFCQPREVFVAPLKAQTKAILVGAALVAALSVAVALGLARFLSAPIRHLTAVVRKISAGDLAVKAEVRSSHEVETLAAAFNQMTGQLRTSIEELQRSRDELEQRVEERTAELREAQKDLLEFAREAGMTEVATSVLHNVGNVLNSVNVAASLLGEKVKGSRGAQLANAVGLLRQHEGDLAAFFGPGGKGKELVAYLGKLSEHMAEERSSMLKQVESLNKNIDHIRTIVRLQQSHARVHGVMETVAIQDVLEDALRIGGDSLSRRSVDIAREYEEIPPISVDKHRLMQILINLITNARHALNEGNGTEKRLSLRVKRAGEDRIRIQVSDTGVGIPAENLTRIFRHGFTTRKDGHGFGLHSSALAAEELGGTLLAESDGPGKGACFTLELPVKK